MIQHLRFIFLYITITLLSGLNIHSDGLGHFSKQGEQEYIDLIGDIFSISADRRAARNFVSEVETFWNAPETSEHLKQLILQVSDKIHGKRGRPFPDYHNYLTTLMTFATKNHSERSFDIWHNGILTLLDNPRYPLRHVNRLFEHTINLLNEDILYSTAALHWKAHHPHYQFNFNDSLYVEITFPATIICLSRNDSIVVENTTGTVNLMSGQWKGDSGRVTWEQSGFKSDMVYATFGEYEIDMTRNRFEIENAEFHNRHYFNYPLEGHIQHRLMNIRNPENTTFPRFESYEQRYQIENIHPNFHYEGGFSQHGSKFLGSGTDNHPAVITIYRNDTAFITAKSLHFALRQDQIVSSNTEITIKLDTGYIYHPGLLFKYMDPIREINLIRDGNGISQSPFFNTYHNISMDTELIRWKVDQSSMELRMITGAAENYAFFESISYFREDFFNQLQGMDAIHPLQGLLNCYRHFDETPFSAKDYARYLRMPENQVRQQIIGLSFHGFIGYNVNTDIIEIRERLTDYLQFRAGNKDYDVIRFRSTTPGSIPNATFDLKNYDLEMNGVSVVTISDRQNVALFPKEERLIMKKDRNFSFDGSIAAGMVNLFGNSFTFNYQDFRVDLYAIDSMAMRIESEGYDYYGRRAQRRINSTISQLSGYLEIDSSDNKSGKEFYPEFPKLTSTTDSYVYYENPGIQNGAYDKETFYFTLDPFDIDSISRLTRRNVEFTGNFTSGIFPDMKEKLMIRPDYSLGFIQNTPENGYPIYDNKAIFNNILDLSNQGLIGDGSLEYLTTTSSSEKFVFLPDETHGLAYNFTIQPRETGVEYPDVHGRFIEIKFQPIIDQLTAGVLDEPFTMYNGETNLEGILTVKPSGLEAEGQFNMPGANLTAKRMNMGHHVVIADSSDFNLISDGEEQDVNFKTSNLLATLDFNSRQGTFSARDLGSVVEFTENRYLAHINEFSWDMDRNDIHLGASGSEGNRFVSTHRRQDSLDFIVPIAQYDVESRRIFAREVKSIQVADTEIILHDGNITINRNAVLDTLELVMIVLADSIHRFYDARVSVEGKYNYSASGKYDFINGNNEVKPIRFMNIEVNNNYQTIADGEISERELFTFNRRFAYKGNVALLAGNPLLKFDGGAQMLHDCFTSGPQYFVRFDSEIDPDHVRIPISENAHNYEFENIYHHFFLNRDSNIVYSAFLEDRWFHSDEPLLSAHGQLGFDETSNSFIIAQEYKINQPDTTGNILRFHNDGCMVTGEGILNMGLDLEHVKTYAAGEINHDRHNSIAQLNTLFGVDFMLDDRSVEIMVNTIKLTESKQGNPDNPATLKRFSEWMGKESAEKVNREMQGFETMRSLPEEHQHLLVMDELAWTWDPDSRSYMADTEVTLATIKDEPINRRVNIKAMISFSRGGNSLDMHLQVCDTTYFFFSYRNSMMQTRSSLAEFNTNVQSLDGDERRIRGGLGTSGYSFILAPESRMRRLLNAFEIQDEDTEMVEPYDESEHGDLEEVEVEEEITDELPIENEYEPDG